MDAGYCENCGFFEDRCDCGRRKILLRGRDRVRISKFLSGLLRHYPDRFGIELDRRGYARLKDVLEILRERYGVGEMELRAVVELDKKRRFELVEGRIRARYGHSVDVDVRWSEGESIPERLYHATAPENVPSILKSGLLPMRRKEVHMTATPEEAVEVGMRHSNTPVLIEIDAERLIEKGIDVRKKGRVFTADHVPADCLRVVGWRKT